MTDGRWLFSYGTLRLPKVQLALFGREIETHDDELEGWRVDEIEIGDADVVETSGMTRHRILRRDAGAPTLRGSVLFLGAADLAAADRYETNAYARITVGL